MKKAIKLFGFAVLTLGLSLTALSSDAQQNYEDYTFEKVAVKDRKVIPYPYLREADVAYSKRIWRIIDVRQKANKILAWPRKSFSSVIYQNVMNGNITPYRNDSLISFYTPEEISEIGVIKEDLQVQDMAFPDDPYATKDTTIVTPFDPEKVVKWKIMEDWIFDKKHSVFFARIIAISPLYKPRIGGVELPEASMYWLKWTDCRPILVNTELFNRKNDAARISIDHFFEKRMFASYIVKQSNEFDYEIKDFPEWKDDSYRALWEAEKIKNDLFIMEHDLWEY